MSRRRRTRYRFTVDHDTRATGEIHVLAYSREAAFAMLEKRGYYNIGEIVASRKPRIPASRANWSPAWSSIHEAIKELRIKWPVSVKQTGHQGGRCGAHTLENVHGQAAHKITVKNWLDPQQAGETLWHELAHAMQCERVARDRRCSASSYREVAVAWKYTNGRRGSYQDRPIEVEARTYERRNAAHPLAVGR